MSPSRRRAAGALALAAALWALAVPVVGASASPGYSHRAQYISELGATGAQCGALVSGAGFAPTGALVIAFLLAAAPLLPRSRATTAGLLGLAVVGAAYLITAIFRCDPGCPSEGSLSQGVHSAAGLFEYVGALGGFGTLAAALWRAPGWRWLGGAAAFAALLIALGLAGMLTPSLAGERGLAQRVAEAGVFGWIALAGAQLLRRAGRT